MYGIRLSPERKQWGKGHLTLEMSRNSTGDKYIILINDVGKTCVSILAMFWLVYNY